MISTEDLLSMNKFDQLYEALVSEIDWRKLANAAPGKAISGAGKATAAAGSMASKGIGAFGYALGTGGKSIPGTQALQAGIQKSTAAVGTGIQKAGSAFSKFSTGQVDTARKKSEQEIAKQLGMPSTQSPKSGDTVNITVGKFAGKGLGIMSPKALFTKPKAYEGGMLYTIPLQGIKVAGKDIAALRVQHNPSAKGAANVYYSDNNNMPIENPEELGLPKTVILKPNPDQQASNWIISDRQTAEPIELNSKGKNIRPGTTIKRNTIIPVQTYGNRVTQYKVLTDPDANGDFVALPV